MWNLDFFMNRKGYIKSLGVENCMLNCYDSSSGRSQMGGVERGWGPLWTGRREGLWRDWSENWSDVQEWRRGRGQGKSYRTHRWPRNVVTQTYLHTFYWGARWWEYNEVRLSSSSGWLRRQTRCPQWETWSSFAWALKTEWGHELSEKEKFPEI